MNNSYFNYKQTQCSTERDNYCIHCIGMLLSRPCPVEARREHEERISERKKKLSDVAYIESLKNQVYEGCSLDRDNCCVHMGSHGPCHVLLELEEANITKMLLSQKNMISLTNKRDLPRGVYRPR
jgi:hypothetical protein